MAVSAAWLEGMKPVPGSLRLILMRWGLWILAALPGMLAGVGAIGQGPARRPFFTEASQPFPIFEFTEFVAKLPGGMWGLLAVGAVVAWLGNLLLTAGAVEVVGTRGRGPVQVWRTVFDAGMRVLLPYLRISFVAAVWLMICSGVAGKLFGWLIDRGQLAGWTGETMFSIIKLRGVVLLLLASAIGVAALWSRVIVASGDRRFVRRLNTIVPRVGWRHPFQGILLPMALGIGSLLLGAWVLFSWRQSGAGATGLWSAVWLTVLLVQSWVWHWRLRICCTVWDDPRHDGIREIPDEPWHVFRRLFGKFRRRQPLPPDMSLPPGSPLPPPDR